MIVSVVWGTSMLWFFFFQAEDGIRDLYVTGVQTCALPIFAQGHPERDRQKPEAAWDGVRGSLHHPSLGLPNPDRGDDRSAARRGAGRQGALYRRLGHVRVAVPEGAARRRKTWVDSLRLDAGSPEPDLPRRGARDAAALPRGEDRGDPV